MTHKARLAFLSLAACLVLAPVAPAQAVHERPAFDITDVAVLAGAAVSFSVGTLADLNTGPPPCAPCDPQDVPGFDRWIIRPVHPGFSTASDVTLAALGAATMVDTWSGNRDRAYIAASLDAVGLAFGVSELTKAVVGRQRPVLYTDNAVEAAADVNSQRSMPSGHTTVAFALATSYWLNNPRRAVGYKIAAMAAAVTVGVLRVAAAKHFPSDVVAGALLGSASAVLVHQIKF